MDEPVLLTGAAGRVGQAILDGIGDDYDWRLFDREPPTGDTDHEVVVGDVTDEDAVREAVAGVGAVIHLAGDPRPEAPWESVLRNNIDGAQTILEVAVEEDVGKFVFASSNHAVGHYETERKPDLYREDDDFRLDGTELPRPSNLYGVSKAAGETLGRYYHDEHDLPFVAVRIGNLTEGHPPIDYERGQAMWLSHRDCAHLFDCCLRGECGYEIVYGISDNERKYYSLERAREVLGYDPQDNSAEWDGDERVTDAE
ncbi:NAD-dependent glucose-6-phosphate dehydrogenase Azf [Halobacterium noricense]|uniref:NAD-dependent glucose-6-phosphate dehydrogenase Azf n=1 Tax=Halobacterium noricense TaxID=223182 RepID=UPI001E545D16|nr:NAD-dependent glucose-6-phosphate dehydrogenase Azf [Halobacterium noricense]UHH25629.1 NAD(P)-dependent oxidoreductase [Halobacterium noricense]